MVAVGSRRALFSAATSTIMTLSFETMDPSSLSEMICNYTPLAFRLAVSNTGTFLYRGESSVERVTILTPEPDLLVPGTYDDPAALSYFQCLEKRLARKVAARPSTGHIATSDRSEAAQWGQAVSVWPLGTSFSFVYSKQDKVFFPTSKAKCPNDELAINHDLEVALQQGHEVLFASSFDGGGKLPDSLTGNEKSAFLVVPEKFEKDLLDIIKLPEFSSPY